RLDIRVTDQPPASDPNRYTPSAALDRYVRLRDRTCRFPGCNRPAEFTDLDHRIAFTAGGRTTADNLQCLCRHHHRLKHEGGWKIHQHPDGTHTWISPTGRRYRENGPPSNPASRRAQHPPADPQADSTHLRSRRSQRGPDHGQGGR
ncbi:HNH endonuclease signature motif containing protein, partial [Kribbella caucasensis]|uniref:HNH endonuclease signature motif containing protein n=1 Tax=Kribbella caucasensis TaxID=2512215 RepID=UPI00105B3141